MLARPRPELATPARLRIATGKLSGETVVRPEGLGYTYFWSRERIPAKKQSAAKAGPPPVRGGSYAHDCTLTLYGQPVLWFVLAGLF
jgi:hypothetical protein